MSDSALQQVPDTLLDEAVVAAERCRWGFTNSTILATLASGRRVIVQQIASQDRAMILGRLTRELPPLLIQAHINTPQLLLADPDALPPFLVRSYIPGDAANQLLGTADGARALAAQMGALLPQIASVAPPAWLDNTWATPEALAGAARVWLQVCASHVSDGDQQLLIDSLDLLSADWPEAQACLAHGDFCPVNAIAEAGQIVALVDLEWSRVATPLFDAAWWGWVVQHHHPERWSESWHVLLAAAGIADTPATQRHIAAIQRLRCLELLSDALQANLQFPSKMWAERLHETLQH